MSVIASASEWGQFVSGAASLEEEPGGVTVHRLPAWARAQVDDPLFSFAEACPVGVTVRFETDASFVTLILSSTTIAPTGADRAPVTLIARQAGSETEVPLSTPSVIFLGPENRVVGVRHQDPETVTVPTAGPGPVEILLPHNAQVRLVSLESAGRLVPSPSSATRWTHYGSSISQGMNAVSAARTWPVAAASRLGWNLRNLSFAGNAQLDGFAARIIRDTPADVITLKVGINLVNADSMRERTFRPAVHAFLDTIREGHPSTMIVMISAVACPIHESAPGPVTKDSEGRVRAASRAVDPDTGALSLGRTREILADVVAGRADERLLLVDGRELFGDEDVAMLYDGLHPDQDGLDLIARRFIELGKYWNVERSGEAS